MRVLVTGAAGFLGTEVVRQLLDRGHDVRAVIRSPSQAVPPEWRNRADISQADLVTTQELERLFDGIDVLVHLAATMRGHGDEQITDTANGTRRLLEAMSAAGSMAHLVLASSCSVYDCTAIQGALIEKSPLETNTYDVSAYTLAKLAQERITRSLAEQHRWSLTVLRPAFIYGPHSGPVAVAGIALGHLFWVIAPRAHLRLSHVENCASAFVSAAEKRITGTFNIIDDEPITAWRQSGGRGTRARRHIRIPVPYFAGITAVKLASLLGRTPFLTGNRPLPEILKPRQFRARFRPLSYDNRLAKEHLNWVCKPRFRTECDVP